MVEKLDCSGEHGQRTLRWGGLCGCAQCGRGCDAHVRLREWCVAGAGLGDEGVAKLMRLMEGCTTVKILILESE